jgi:hypothetical protein
VLSFKSLFEKCLNFPVTITCTLYRNPLDTGDAIYI